MLLLWGSCPAMSSILFFESMEDKNKNKEWGQQIENNNKYGRYSYNYINNHLMQMHQLKHKDCMILEK